MQQRLPSLLPEPILFAHRGARAHARENTIEAFQLALRLGATGLESDVWVTADGVAVLDHDGVLRSGWRTKRPIADAARDELPAHIPALSDLLDECGTDFHLSLDVKDPAAGPLIVDTIARRSPALVERTWLCHADIDYLVDLRRHGPSVKLVNSQRLSSLDGGPERWAALLAERSIDAMNMRRTDWNGGLVTMFHRFERAAFGWDLQHEHQLVEHLRMGIDAVYSDHVDRMTDAARTTL